MLCYCCPDRPALHLAGEEGRPLSLVFAGAGQRGMPWVTEGPPAAQTLEPGSEEGAEAPMLSSSSPFASGTSWPTIKRQRAKKAGPVSTQIGVEREGPGRGGGGLGGVRWGRVGNRTASIALRPRTWGGPGMEKLLYKPLGKGFLAQAGPLYCVWLGSGGPGSSREIPGSMKEMQEGVGPKQSGQPPREPGGLNGQELEC